MLDFSSPTKPKSDTSQIALKRKLMEDRLLKKAVVTRDRSKKKEYTKEELA